MNKKNKNNFIDTLNRFDTYVIDNNFIVKRNLNKIIEIQKPELVYPPQNFIWFHNNSFNLQFFNQYQRDINGFLFQIEPNKKDIIKNNEKRKKRMNDPKKGINSPAFKKFMASQGM